MVNRICDDTAGYELWSKSGSSKRKPESAHGVPSGCLGSGLGLGLVKQRSTKEYLTRKLKSSSEICEGYVILDSYAILYESKTSSAFELKHHSWRQH